MPFVIKPGKEEEFLKELCDGKHKRILVSIVRPTIATYYVYPDDFDDASKPWQEYLQVRKEFREAPRDATAELLDYEGEDLASAIVSGVGRGIVPIKIVEVVCKSGNIQIKTLIDKGFSK